MNDLEAWLRAHLDEDRGSLLGQGYQATVHYFDSPVGGIVVKGPHAGALRERLGRAAIAREHRVYSRLEGVAGIPRLFGLIDGRLLVLEHVDGNSLREAHGEISDRERFFAKLIDTVEAMHRRGVAHGDLKRKDNVLVGPGEVPFIIDFGVACTFDAGQGFVRRKCFETIRQMDLNAWIKLKHGRHPTDLPPADAARYKPLWLERIARWIRIPWQTLTLRRPRQRWRKRR
jgi:serine/threonine protein kinase